MEWENRSVTAATFKISEKHTKSAHNFARIEKYQFQLCSKYDRRHT